MKNKLNQTITMTALAAIFFLNSCKKEEPVTPTGNPVTNAAVFAKIAKAQATSVENMFRSKAIADGAVLYATTTHKKEGDWYFGDFPCAVITQDTVSSPRSVTVDFGPQGCKNPNGDFFSGRIMVQYSNVNFTSNPGNYAKITVTNLINNYDTVNGTIQFTYAGINNNGNPTESITTNLTTSEKHDELKYTGTNNITIEFVADTTGGTSNTHAYFSGSGSGTTNDGFAFTQTINTPLLSNEQCEAHFVSGVLEIQTQGQPDKFIDYGNGTCDDQATMRQNGVVSTITLQ